MYDGKEQFQLEGNWLDWIKFFSWRQSKKIDSPLISVFWCAPNKVQSFKIICGLWPYL